ncbi:hypothetical protein H8959_022272 [Pygathrix nigripes]
MRIHTSCCFQPGRFGVASDAAEGLWTCFLVSTTVHNNVASSPLEPRCLPMAATGPGASQVPQSWEQGRDQKFRCQLIDSSEDLGMVSIQGTASQAILQEGLEADLSNEAFPFSTHKMLRATRQLNKDAGSVDLYEHKFINCRFINSTFLEQKEGCHMDLEQDNDFLIYLVSFLGSLSVIPGNIISALLMDRIGRLKMIVFAVCCFFLFFGNTEFVMISWQCLFCGTSIAAWNALDVITVELYPTNQRATAFGILNGLCKFGTFLGNTIFASFVGITKVVPIPLAAASLVGGGLIALRLPETREQVLM